MEGMSDQQDRGSRTGFVARHPATTFFTLAFLISWGGVLAITLPTGIPGEGEACTHTRRALSAVKALIQKDSLSTPPLDHAPAACQENGPRNTGAFLAVPEHSFVA